MNYYTFPQQGFQPNPAMYQQPNVLQQQQILQANGKASIDALRMAPNSSVLIMDKTAPIVWLCTSDGIGNVTSVPYDIVAHKEPGPVDYSGLEERIRVLEEKLNAKSNDAADRTGKDGKPWPNKTNAQQPQVNGKPSDHAQ